MTDTCCKEHGAFATSLSALKFLLLYIGTLQSHHPKRNLFHCYCSHLNMANSVNGNSVLKWAEGFCCIRDFTMNYHYTIPTSPLPKLVFLHALTATGRRFIPLFSKLGNDFQLFLPSARGHGKSNPIPAGSFLMENIVEDTAQFICHISPGSPVYLAAHSFGAATAARTAKKYPELVKKLVLEDPPWTRNAGEQFDAHAAMAGGGPTNLFKAARLLKSMSDDEFEKVKNKSPFELLPPPNNESRRGPGRPPQRGRGSEPPHGGRGGPTQGGMSEAVYSGPFSQTGPEGLKELAVDEIEPTFMEGVEKYVKEGVEGIQVPTILLTGEPGMSHCLPHVAKQVLSTWPNGIEKNFPGAGHGIHNPPNEEEFLRTLRYFFSS